LKRGSYFGVPEENLGNIYCLNVSTGKTIELTSKNMDLYDQWIVVSN